jgi:hypothetical protein
LFVVQVAAPSIAAEVDVKAAAAAKIEAKPAEAAAPASAAPAKQ